MEQAYALGPTKRWDEMTGNGPAAPLLPAGGDLAGPVAVLLPGTASSGAFVAATFGPALSAAGYALVTGDPPRGPGLLPAWYGLLDAAVRRYRPRLVGGVSLGAHLAARWLTEYAGDEAGAGIRGLVVALPGWLGRPGADTPAALASRAGALAVRRDGLAATLARTRAETPGWLGDELVAAWSRYRPDELVDTLLAAAAAPAPDAAELAALGTPAGVVGFADDPVHPAAVARDWARLLPRSGYRELPMAALGADPGRLGREALSALAAAG